MSLKIKMQQDKIRKFLNALPVATITYVVQGTFEDVLAGNHEDSEPMMPGYTAGQFRSNPALQFDRKFVECAVGAAVGRLAHHWCMLNGIDHVVAIPLLGLTAKVEQMAVEQILSRSTLH